MLGDAIRSVLPELQAQAESMMADMCIIRRQTGETTNPDTGEIVPVYTEVYGTDTAPGKCRLRHRGAAQPTDRNVGEQYVQLTHPELQVPVSATGVDDGDVAEIITSVDPDLVGHMLHISAPFAQTQSTMRRFPVEEAT
ncbi:MAG: DUF6093 family protein [Nocardioidaceae bacterium]